MRDGAHDSIRSCHPGRNAGGFGAAGRTVGDTSLPVNVAVGSKSEPFFHSGAKGLVQIVPSAQYHALAGMNHGALLSAPSALGKDVEDFLLRL